MNVIDILPYKKLYFIGIGGVSMSGLCEILLKENYYNIYGSDNSNSTLIENLVKKGVKVYIGQNSCNISKDIDLVVYTAAIKPDNEEFIRAKELNLKMMERSVFLGELMKAYKYPICIAGTHGKTTTTSLISEIFLKTDKNPTISLGGILSSINSNFKVGDKNFFIVETCEYCDSFLKFNPHSAIILNIEADHLDYFKDLNQIYNSFKNFAKLIPKDACLVINSDIENYEFITNDLNCNVITYGKNENSMWKAENISFDKQGFPSFSAIFKGIPMFNIKLNTIGLHNVYNALSVCALSNFYEIPKNIIESGLNEFKGIKRRFEYKGKFNNIKVIDDYAHHPTEIKAVINSIKNTHSKNIWYIFQPHTYSRTKALLDDFAESFEDAENILIFDIYSAREKDNGEIHSKDLVSKLKEKGKNALYIENFDDGLSFLQKNCNPYDMIITLGAGNIYLLGEMFLKNTI